MRQNPPSWAGIFGNLARLHILSRQLAFPAQFPFLYVCVFINYLAMLEMLRQYVSGYVALTKEEFALLGDRIVVRNFDKKEQMLRAGEVEQYLNFVVKGLARMYFYKGKTQVITNIAKEGEIISSSSSFLSATPSNYFVETLEPSTFLSISRVHLDQAYRDSPRIEKLGRLMTTYFVLQKEEWELECMRLDTKERFLRFIGNNPDLVQRVPQKYLASYLNMKPETFSRLKHFIRKRPPSGR
jgi:CRP-like cAMP-binding protein